jgi:mannose-6-phosphate isomerase-like protein (cupin superfamily)
MQRLPIAAVIVLCAAAPVLAQTSPAPPAPSARPAATPQPPIVFADQAQAAALLAKAKWALVPGQAQAPDQIMLRADGNRTAIEYRVGPTPPAIHPAQNELVYVLEGSAVLVMGGTMVNAAGASVTQGGVDITGGDTYRLEKGGFVLVPAGTPHWFKTVGADGFSSLHVLTAKGS